MDPAQLYRRVRAVIAKKAGISVEKVKCEALLSDSPIYLTAVQRQNLAPRFQEIARELKPKAEILQAETEKLKDVLAAYNLVGSRAGLVKVTCKDSPPIPFTA